MGLDMNFGIYYTHKRFYAGFGMTHITQPEPQLDENAYTYIGRSLNLMGGYNIQLKESVDRITALGVLADRHAKFSCGYYR